MSASEPENRYTAINVARSLISLVPVYVAYRSGYPSFLVAMSTFAALATAWLVLTELRVLRESRHPRLAYIPTTIDMMVFTIFVYFSGTVNSFIVAGYVLTTALSSLNTRVNQGRYAVLLSITLFVSMSLAVYLGILPRISVFEEGASAGGYALLFAFFFVPSAIILVHVVVQGLTRRNEQLLQDARAAVRSRTDFLANMSHEIRTPLNALLGANELLREANLTDDEARLVDLSSRACVRLNGLLNDVLDFARLDANQVALDESRFDARDAISETALLFLSQARSKGLNFRTMFEPDTELRVFGDRERLQRIVAHALDNALKFTEQGDVTLRVASRHAPSTLELEVTVRDSGIGIHEEDQKHIFDTFHQGKHRPSHRYGGRGLGLPISRALARLMGGDLKVESEPGRGTRVCLELSLPRAQGGEWPEARQGLRILIAEDAEENRILMARFLAGNSFRLEFAEHGRRACELFELQDYDLVFMDLQMPEMDGYAATRYMRSLEAKRGQQPTPIVALTANAMPEQVDQAMESGCTLFLTKPITRNTVLETIERCTATRGSAAKAG